MSSFVHMYCPGLCASDCSCARSCRVQMCIFRCAHRPTDSFHHNSARLSTVAMKQFPSEAKHAILLEYSPHTPSHSFAALAARHGIAGGRDVVRRWHKRWNGTPQSLQHSRGAGRPRVLSAREVQQHVRAPILRANRAHRSVHYPSVVRSACEKTGKSVSIQTIRRYGKKELEATQRRGKKRTAEECECTHDKRV